MVAVSVPARAFWLPTLWQATQPKPEPTRVSCCPMGTRLVLGMGRGWEVGGRPCSWAIPEARRWPWAAKPGMRAGSLARGLYSSVPEMKRCIQLARSLLPAWVRAGRPRWTLPADALRRASSSSSRLAELLVWVSVVSRVDHASVSRSRAWHAWQRSSSNWR